MCYFLKNALAERRESFSNAWGLPQIFDVLLWVDLQNMKIGMAVTLSLPKDGGGSQ